MLDFLGDLKRTHMCGALRPSDAGKKAVLMGWVNRRRDLGSIIFIDLRDRTGVTQVVFNRELNPKAHEKANHLRNEYVIAVIGTVKRRDADTINKNIPTGEVELMVDEIRLLNESKQPPFLPSETVLPNEEMRLKYRYIDLRREPMQFNIEMRHKVSKAIRDYLSAEGFFEIETPFMTRSTPEGARDYLVPSRVQPGSFYALPQSPQMFKQILMISGFDRYFQIVRCFRDEDLRADRQPEFTQIDLEMSYPQTESVWSVVEGFLTAAFKAAGHEIKTPFPRMSYDEAIQKYGNDKPDLRLPAMIDARDALTPEEWDDLATKFRMRKEFPLQLIRIPKAGDISGTERRTIGTYGAYQHVQGPSFVQLMTDPRRFAKDYPTLSEKVLSFAKIEPDDLWLLAGSANRPENAAVMDQSAQHFCEKCGFLRLDLAQKYAAKHKAFEKTGDTAKDFRFLWVSDFPMFEWDKTEKRWNPAHHPFTSLHEEDMAKLEANIDSVHDPKSPLGEIRALAYDVVLNGTELGSGSIRIHRQDIQRKIFQALGMSDEEARARFGFFLEALEYGTPPHGGIALGLDRIVMILAGADSLREVIPFPKTARAVDLMVDAPTPVAVEQEEELELMSAWAGLNEREWALARLCDKLLAITENAVSDRELPANTKYQLATAMILGKARNDARGAVKLAKAGYGKQAAALSRSIVEAAINVQYIAQDPNERAAAFVGLLHDENWKLSSRLKVHPVSQEVEAALSSIERITKKSPWPTNLMTRAYAVEKPSYAYDVVFLMLSHILHSTPSSLTSQLKEEGELRLSLQTGPSHDWVDTAFATVFIFFAQVADAAFKTFDLDNNELNSAIGAFTRLTESTM